MLVSCQVKNLQFISLFGLFNKFFIPYLFYS